LVRTFDIYKFFVDAYLVLYVVRVYIVRSRVIRERDPRVELIPCQEKKLVEIIDECSFYSLNCNRVTRVKEQNQDRVIRNRYPADTVVCFVDTYPLDSKGSYPLLETNFEDFCSSMNCLFMNSSPFTPKTSMLILLTVCHFILSQFHIFT